MIDRESVKRDSKHLKPLKDCGLSPVSLILYLSEIRKMYIPDLEFKEMDEFSSLRRDPRTEEVTTSSSNLYVSPVYRSSDSFWHSRRPYERIHGSRKKAQSPKPR